MNFSIILNSRNRKEQLTNLLKSIVETSTDISMIEVLICIDEDDKTMLSSYEDFYQQFNFVQFLIISPTTSNLHFNLNSCIPHTTGKYIFGLNDDCILLNQNWDSLSLSKLDSYLKDKTDGIVYGRTYDNSVDKGGTKQYSSFPILSKRAVETLGFYMDEKFVGWGGDVSCWRIFNSINRICELPDLTIDHIYHNTLEQIYNPDETQKRVRIVSNLHSIDCFSYDISKEVERLKCQIQC